ncbi:MAG: sterol desaturase family protein, partial [Acidimicrobiales bacterium]
MDLTVVAIPVYFSTMGAEYLYLKNEAMDRAPTGGDYTREDTMASLAMGTASLLAPFVSKRIARAVAPGSGRYGKILVGTAVGAAALTTVADVVARRAAGPLPEAGTVPARDAQPEAIAMTRVGAAPGSSSSAEASMIESSPAPTPAPTADAATENRSGRRKVARLAKRVASSSSVAAVAGGVLAGATAWSTKTAAKRLWDRHDRDLGGGAAAVATAILAWDFVYYWNHRFMHESRWMWALHVVHHSSEHYNLSTALRQPVADLVGIYVPFGALALLGIRPEHIETARGVNLLYQYWIHTETIGKLGPVEQVFNTASHHRVHHGSNRQYLDRNHGSILIVWDRLFGTFEREGEQVRYGLTKNIHTYNPARIATHEYVDILRDVARSDSWSDRLGFAFRGPGWAYDRHAQRQEPQPAAG